ncbi:gamma-glutamyl-gamma-aminobutyrate hydrolase family protein [Oryzihumus sp.]|uniref:gamma-glutamyl-gamma-aminobutyrate hydrolase family protein n=1 Tax=Oryzihumus sp. TaxID=1968903 RepID=UPI002EDB7CEA
MGEAFRPVIGITCYVEPATRGDWTDVPSALLPQDYVTKVEAAGGIALLVPPRLDADDELARAVLSRLDGLILAGGADVEPSRYAAQPHPGVQPGRPDRDALELALARASAEQDVAVLGICRGMQVMAVAAGGHLEQHVPDRVGHDEHSPAPGVYGSHPVTTVAGTRLAAILGTAVDVPTYHHQSVLEHPGYVPSAWAGDGTLEAMEDPRARFRIAVQWHPEAGADPRLFEALVQECRDRAVRG